LNTHDEWPRARGDGYPTDNLRTISDGSRAEGRRRREEQGEQRGAYDAERGHVAAPSVPDVFSTHRYPMELRMAQQAFDV
jgi:hypothetical protein